MTTLTENTTKQTPLSGEMKKSINICGGPNRSQCRANPDEPSQLDPDIVGIGVRFYSLPFGFHILIHCEGPGFALRLGLAHWGSHFGCLCD